MIWLYYTPLPALLSIPEPPFRKNRQNSARKPRIFSFTTPEKYGIIFLSNDHGAPQEPSAACANQVFDPAFSQKAGRGLGGSAPQVALRRGRNPPMIQQDQEGKAGQPGGLSGRGEPYQGVPRRTQSCKTASLPQPTPRAALPPRVPTIGTPSPRPFPFFEAPLALGEPLDRVPHPLLIFWEHWGISLSAESDQRRCLWNLPAF